MWALNAMLFCISKNVQRLEFRVTAAWTQSSLWRSCVSPPKSIFIIFTGCNDNYISYLWLFNVPKMLPVFDRPSTAESSNCSFGWRCFRLFWATVPPSKAAICGDPETEPRSPSHRHSCICRTTWGQSHSGWTAARAGPPRRWARVGRGGGLTVGITCLRTVKEQLYMQAALNQTCIPPLTQYTQIHKLAHT